MRSIVTLAGIDEAISNLGYTNERHIKARVIRAIRQFYSDENSTRTLTDINTDDLIRLVWDTDGDSEGAKNKRKNFSSIKSSINADLTKLHEHGKNPEGITIGRNNTFDMSDKAKTELLENFSGSGDGDNLIPLGKINYVLGIINDLLKKDKAGAGIEYEENRNSFKQLKDLIQSISQSLGISGDSIADAKETVIFQAAEGVADNLKVVNTYRDLKNAGVEETPKNDLEEIGESGEVRKTEKSEELVVLDELPPAEEIEEDIEAVEDEDLEALEEVEDLEVVEEDEDLEALEEDENLEVVEEDEDIEDAEIEEVPEDELQEVEVADGAFKKDGAFEKGDTGELEVIDELHTEEEIDGDIEAVEDEDLEALEEVEDLEVVEEDEDLEALEDDENLEVVEEDEDIEDVRTEEINRDRLLADEFNNMLSEMDRYYNQYIFIPRGRYLVGGKDLKRNGRAADTVDIKAFSFGKFPVTNALFEIFVEKTGHVTTAERIGHGTVYYGRYQNIIDPKTGLKTLNWNSAVETRVIEGACWYQPAGPGSTLHGKRNHPVVQVSLDDAMAFAKWTGKRLPTESQWEAASRTPEGWPYPWAKEYRKECCNIEDSYIGDTTPVDKYPGGKNSLGVMDTLGNIMEWTADTHQSSTNNRNGFIYIVKGGSWISGNDISLHDRSFSEPDSTSNILGFRCIAC